MKAYSLDLRERVVRAVDQGYKRADIILNFTLLELSIDEAPEVHEHL